ncbi:MAG: SMC family ATPase [Candidatus Micrarchaeia archaeon]
MIEKVILKNFISHADTEVLLEEGVNIFVGSNGSGKSSVIDAITYGLFGEHTRGDNRNLVRYGASNGAVAVLFSAGGRKFSAERRFDATGKLESATLRDVNNNQLLVAGERRQKEESMTKEVEKILQLDYSKVKIAAIVQQGELNSIIKCDPRELKELINKIIGIDKLDTAFINIKEAIDSFRAKLRNIYGYDDSNLENILSQIEEFQKQKKDAEENQKKVNQELSELYKKDSEIKEKIKLMEPLKEKATALKTKKESLIKYVKTKIQELKKQIEDSDEIVGEGKKYLTIIEEKNVFMEENQKLIEKEKRLTGEQKNLSTLLSRWQVQLEVAGKLEFKDNICPVCGSKVEKINPIFDKDELSKHIKEVTNKLKDISDELNQIETLKKKFKEKEKALEKAEAWLESHKIQNLEQIVQLEKERNQIVEKINKILTNMDSANIQVMAIDEYSNDLVEEISSLEKEIAGFDEKEYEHLKKSLEKEIQPAINEKTEEKSRYEEKKKAAEEKLKKLEEAYMEISRAKKYLNFYEKIRSEIFNRDGQLALSLRSWALKEISDMASEYIRLFEMGISRISLEEKKREVDIKCYGSRGLIDINSMSGGEQVAVALALRFAMANLMGKGRIDFVILDEPTAHLDVERRRSLVELIGRLNSRLVNMFLKQIIIITHDEEIFANSEVSALFKFQIVNNMSKVTKS